MRTHVLTRNLHNRFLKRFGEQKLTCATCGKPLREDDVVVSVEGRGSFIVRHKACFDTLWLEV